MHRVIPGVTGIRKLSSIFLRGHKKMSKFKVLNVLLASMVLMAVAGCGGQKTAEKKKEVNWPTKSVQLICPMSAGGDTDYNARTLAKHLEKKLGKPVVVTNVTGSGGTIGAAKVKNSNPDGYTALFAHTALNVSAASKRIDFSYKDFVMGGIAARAMGDALIVSADCPWHSVKEMIADTQAHPGQYKFPVMTGGTTNWVAVALKKAGAEFNYINSGSAADRIVMLLGGQVNIIHAAIPTVKDYLKTGKFRLLATTTPERVKEYPDVPTLKESGVDCAFILNYTILFPKGTDPAIAQKMNEAVADVVKNDKEYAQEIESAYLQKPYSASIEDSNKYWENEYNSLMKISDELQGKK
jgi:tripartite-type tricarboxylate transporter receptor subunit TctC